LKKKFYAGDEVRVRDLDSILATLDGSGTVDGMPFMPEMAQFCGNVLRISKVAHKTCDTAFKTGGRTLRDFYHVGETRCTGAAHGGCQATCLLFWHVSWLERADANGRDATRMPCQPTDDRDGPRCTLPQVEQATQHHESTGASPRYSCQATCLYGASRPLAWWDPSHYVRDVTSGNVPPGLFFRVLLVSWLRALTALPLGYRLFRVLYEAGHRALLGGAAPLVENHVPQGQRTPEVRLDLKPGERVIVRDRSEIFATLDARNRNRGLWFDREYLPYCKTAQVVSHRVERIIDERSGEMLQMKSPCIVLRGVECKAFYSGTRLFCPRAITAYWRESWLRRDTVTDSHPDSSSSAAQGGSIGRCEP
jgi:hypothetical protein